MSTGKWGLHHDGAGVGGGTLLKMIIKMSRDKAREGLEIISSWTPTAQDYGQSLTLNSVISKGKCDSSFGFQLGSHTGNQYPASRQQFWVWKILTPILVGLSIWKIKPISATTLFFPQVANSKHLRKGGSKLAQSDFFPVKPFQLLIITSLWFTDPKFLAYHSSHQWAWVNPNFSWNRFSYVEFFTCTHSSKTKINLHKWRQKLIHKSQVLQNHEKLTSLMLGNETNRVSQISLKKCVNRANN